MSQKSRTSILPYVLLSPAVDCTFDSHSMVDNESRDPLFRLSDLLVLRRHYVPSPHLYTHPEVSPLFADFTGFAPLLLQAAIPAASPHAATTATIRRTRLPPLRRSDSPRPKILATPGPPGRSTCSDTPSG